MLLVYTELAEVLPLLDVFRTRKVEIDIPLNEIQALFDRLLPNYTFAVLDGRR